MEQERLHMNPQKALWNGFVDTQQTYGHSVGTEGRVEVRGFSRAFPSQFTTGLALSQIGNDFVRPPSDTSLREATVRVFNTGPLHGYLEKGAVKPVGGDKLRMTMI
jgi:hypothetical protein